MNVTPPRPTPVCEHFACQEWLSNGNLKKPELVREEKNGFWICPKCGSSYGAHADEPFNPFELDGVS